MIRHFNLRYWVLVMTVIASASAQAEKLTLSRIFAAPDLSGASLRSPQVSPDGRLVTYLRGKDSNKDRFDLWAYDVQARKHRLLVDSALLTPEDRPLSAEEAQRRERQRTSSLSGIIEYQFSSDARYCSYR
jgi:dipeptidyl-peptidase-4